MHGISPIRHVASAVLAFGNSHIVGLDNVTRQGPVVNMMAITH